MALRRRDILYLIGVENSNLLVLVIIDSVFVSALPFFPPPPHCVVSCFHDSAVVVFSQGVVEIGTEIETETEIGIGTERDVFRMEVAITGIGATTVTATATVIMTVTVTAIVTVTVTVTVIAMVMIVMVAEEAMVAVDMVEEIPTVEAVVDTAVATVAIGLTVLVTGGPASMTTGMTLTVKNCVRSGWMPIRKSLHDVI